MGLVGFAFQVHRSQTFFMILPMELDQPRITDIKKPISNSSPPFDLVNKNLQSIGAISLNRFLSSTSDADFETIGQFAENASSVTEPSGTQYTVTDEKLLQNGNDSDKTTDNAAIQMKNVARLHQACQRAFGNSGGLNFEYLQESGPNSKQCILTIARANGTTRLYKTEPIYSKKADAQSQAANIAVKLGALQFIATGDSDVVKPTHEPPAAPLGPGEPVQGGVSDPVDLPEPDDLDRIETCCAEWRAGLVKPYWVEYRDSAHGPGGYGFALRIELNRHAFRVYSTDAVFETVSAAKIACAKDALEQGVLDYIRYGNGQTEPPARPIEDDRVSEPFRGLTSAISLQGFYEGLPQPFPEPVKTKIASEINSVAWLNKTLQSAAGGRLRSNFFWMMDTDYMGLHGCLLRLEGPKACMSYLAVPLFQKRADAKAAACLLAMSQGVGDYIRQIAEDVRNKVSESSRKFANQFIYSSLVTECRRIRQDSFPQYLFHNDRDACGCTLSVDLSASSGDPDIRTYRVEAEYRNKADAKVAVSCLAVEQGIFELLRFRGASPPPGYVSFLEAYNRNSASRKRKDPEPSSGDGAEDQKHKKQKLDSKQTGVTQHYGGKVAGDDPSASGSSGITPVNGSAHAADYSTGKYQYGHRSVGNSMAPHNPSFLTTPPIYTNTSFPTLAHSVYGTGNIMQQTYQFSPYGSSVGIPTPAQYMPSRSTFQPQGSISYADYVQSSGAGQSMTPYRGYQAQSTSRGAYAHNTHLNAPVPRPNPGSAGSLRHPDQPPGRDDTALDYGDHKEPYRTGLPTQNGKKTKISTKSERGPVIQEGRYSTPATSHTASSTTTPQSGPLNLPGIPSASKSHVDALIEFCIQQKKPGPHFYREAILENSETRYRVWVEMGPEKLEIPTTFSTVDEGRERLAKQILGRLWKTKTISATAT